MNRDEKRIVELQTVLEMSKLLYFEFNDEYNFGFYGSCGYRRYFSLR